MHSTRASPKMYVNEQHLNRSALVQIQTKHTYTILFLLAIILCVSSTVIVAKAVLLKKGTRSTTVETSIERTAASVTSTSVSTVAENIDAITTLAIKEVNNETEWEQDGIIVAGGFGRGDAPDQLNSPVDMAIDLDRTLYVVDQSNDRVVRWRFDATFGDVVAGGNGRGNRIDQLAAPSDVLIDRNNGSLLICDLGNRRVVRTFHQSPQKHTGIILHIDCAGLAMDQNGDLYIACPRSDLVGRWRPGERQETIVAGGNERGDHLNQLNFPRNVFVDADLTIYVTDSGNHRVTKWFKGATEGIVVAGGLGEGKNLSQLSWPHESLVDRFGNVYVADTQNHRVIRFSRGSREGTAVVWMTTGLYGNDFHSPGGIELDQQGNLYVVHWNLDAVQKYSVRR